MSSRLGGWARRASLAGASVMAWALVLGSIGPIAGCSSGGAAPRARSSAQASTASPSDRSGESAAPTAELAINAEIAQQQDWTFDGKPGRLFATTNYRVFTTQNRGTLVQRLPLFLETALVHYRTGLTGASSPLPAPPLKLDTFIMGTRPEWELLSRQLLAEQAEPFLKIRRGGFAYGGRALLFDVGTFDTLAVTAHEGWHQYTQRSFGTQLPVWLEEGIATYMEGHRWEASGGSRPVFLPWANVERFDQLRRAEARKQLMALPELLNATPQNLISGASNEPGLVYYAQVWALTHFLNEGAGGRYRDKLQTAILDAASGRLGDVMRGTLGGRASGMLASRKGPALFVVYFNDNLAEVGVEFDEFIQKLVGTGSRSAIVQGVSPFATPALAPAR